MIFLSLLILVTIALAATAAYFSIVGLAALFSFHYWGTVIMGASLEAGKLITTSYLYKYWKKIDLLRKYLMALMVILLMLLTSIGIFGYLMQGFQEGSSNKGISTVKLEANQKELLRVEARLKDIESQISNLPSTSVSGRIRLEKTYREEASLLKSKLFQLTKEQSDLKISSLESDSHLGPIVYIAKELGVDSAKAATYLVLLIIVIFDPLTVLLTISINHVLNERQNLRTNPEPSGGTTPGSETGDGKVTRNETEEAVSKEEGKKNEEDTILEEVVEDPTPPFEESSNPPTLRKVIAATNSGQLIYED